MCGLTVFINPRVPTTTAVNMFNMSKRRGPDHSNLLFLNSYIWLGFHRLAINGLNEQSNQPLRRNDCYLVCNGEIYNSAELYQSMGVEPATDSDCEVILHLYQHYGIEATLQMIDASEFAFVLYDAGTNNVYAARDPLGVRPLFRADNHGMVIFGSELKSLQYPNTTYAAVQPGTFEQCVDGAWSTVVYSTPPFSLPVDYSINPHGLVFNALYNAVMKRVRNTDRPMACLLSGGLDSSIIAALVVRCRHELGINEPLETYAVGMEGAEDIRYATIMARHLYTNHTNIILDQNEFLNAIPEVIRSIESYDTTTVRASVGNYLVAKHIAAQSQAKVIFNGDFSDELTGGYLYFRFAPDVWAADAECRRLLKDIHAFDALRSDKTISSHGLEPRTPFADRNFVQTYLSLAPETRFPIGGMEKQFLRETFANILPQEIAWRVKEAFSDGVSSVNNSWYQIIANNIPPHIEQSFRSNLGAGWVNPPKTPEQFYYRMIYNSFYLECANTIPYFWMPRFVEASDCSARTLFKS